MRSRAHSKGGADSAPIGSTLARGLLAAVPFDVELVRKRLEADGGGYQIVHTSPGLEIGVYVLWAPEPDRQEPHADDEVYLVLDGQGVLEVEGRAVPLQPGEAVYVPAGARHGFTAYEQLSVLVIFARQWRIQSSHERALAPL